MTRSATGRPPHRAALAGLIALLLYLPAFWWGAPHATAPDRVASWGVDDETPLGPIAEIYNIVRPQADRNLGYPLGYSLMTAAAYAPYVGYLKLTGQLGAVSATYPFGLHDPVGALRTLSRIAHLLTVLLGAGVILAVFDAARTVWDDRTAALAAAFAAVVGPMFYYARTGNVDVPMLFFVALSVALFARAVVFGLSIRRAVWLGIAIGIALGTKESSAGAFLAMPVVLAVTHWRAEREPGGRRHFFRAPAAGLLAAVLALGLSSGLFIDPDRYFDHLAFLSGRIDMASTGQVLEYTFPYTWEGNVEYAGRLIGYLAALLTWPGLALAILGGAWAVARQRRAVLLALPAATYLAFTFLTVRAAQLRYMLPVGFGMAFFAARAVTLAWDSRRAAFRVAAGAAAAFALTVSLLRGIDLTYQMISDSRYRAGAWLAQRTEAGSRIEYFGASQKLPPLPVGVETATATPYFGMFVQPPTDSARAQEILQGWKLGNPAFIIVIPDHTSDPGAPYDNTMPPELYDALMGGTAGFHLAAYFRTPPLFPFIPPILLDYPTVNPPIRIFEPGPPPT